MRLGSWYHWVRRGTVLLAAVASTDEAGPGPRLIRGRSPPRPASLGPTLR